MAFSLFSAWVFAPSGERYAKEQEQIKQIVWQALSEKYEIDMNQSAASMITYAIKSKGEFFTNWKELADDTCVYIYGDCYFNGEISSYYGIYSVGLRRVTVCEIK